MAQNFKKFDNYEKISFSLEILLVIRGIDLENVFRILSTRFLEKKFGKNIFVIRKKVKNS